MQLKWNQWLMPVLLASAVTQQTVAAPNGNMTLPGATTQFNVAEFPLIAGNFLQITSNYSTAKQFNDHNGDKSYSQDKRSAAQTLKLTTTWQHKLLGSDVTASEIIGTYVNLKNDIHTPVGTVALNDDGLSEVQFNPLILQWNYGQRGQWHVVAGLGFVLPVGNYNKTDPVNVAGNYFSFSPRFALKYIFQNGFEAAVSPMLNFNWKNEETDSKTGNEINIDYIVAYHYQQWRWGATGYFYRQFANDEQDGVEIAHSKTEAFSIGPALQYHMMNGRGPLLSASWVKDIEAKNKSKGETFWLSVGVKY
jgi:hypothetical protein